jgi:MFS transporter, DHA1 family, multidrug resistance protein
MNTNASEQQKNQGALRISGVSAPEQHVLANEEKSTRVRVRHVLLLGAMATIGPLSSDMYLPSLPTMSHELGATMALTQMTLTASLFGGALGQMIIGPISDARGRRGPLLVGMALYTLTSLLCLVAPSVDLLMGLRFAQGLTAAAGVVIARAIARDGSSSHGSGQCKAYRSGVVAKAADLGSRGSCHWWSHLNRRGGRGGRPRRNAAIVLCPYH